MLLWFVVFHRAVAAVWPQNGLVQYYDSLNGSGSSIMNNLARWLVDDAADKKVQLPWLQTRNADGQQQPKQQQQQQQWQGQQQQPQRQQHKRQQQRRQQQPWLQQLRCEAVRAGMPQQVGRTGHVPQLIAHCVGNSFGTIGILGDSPSRYWLFVVSNLVCCSLLLFTQYLSYSRSFYESCFIESLCNVVAHLAC